MKKKIDLRELRKKAGKTLEEVAAGTGLPYSTVRAIEVGMGKNFAPTIKHKISDFFGVNFLAAFPEEFLKLEAAMSRGYHVLAVLEDWTGGLNIDGEEKHNWLRILNRMSPEEIDEDILHSGQTEENLREMMKKYEKKYGRKK
jgi:transcriptional regulator with XRE-family HTH domain